LAWRGVCTGLDKRPSADEGAATELVMSLAGLVMALYLCSTNKNSLVDEFLKDKPSKRLIYSKTAVKTENIFF
jgi:hypothetical protein